MRAIHLAFPLLVAATLSCASQAAPKPLQPVSNESPEPDNRPSDAYALWARFRDASGMPVGSRVVVAGLPVGEIIDLEIEGRHARVTFKIRGDIEIWSSGVVFKKATSLLGVHYLEIDPGEIQTKASDGTTLDNVLLVDGDQVPRVVETTSADQRLRRLGAGGP